MWEDGANTAKGAAGSVKHNQQLTAESPGLARVQTAIKGALASHPETERTAYPSHILDPFINRHDAEQGHRYGPHVDRALRVRYPSLRRFRADISCTILLSDHEDFSGGDLTIYDGVTKFTPPLQQGDAVFYPSTYIHEVAQVTRGTRYAACTWIQSAIPDANQRRVLKHLHDAIQVNARIQSPNQTQTDLALVQQALHQMWASV